MTRSIFFGLILIALFFDFTAVEGYTIDPTVTVNYQQFNVDQRKRVEDLERMLTEYLENWDDVEGEDFDIEIPLTMQITLNTSGPQGTVFQYGAFFVISDQAEFLYTDNKWEFLMAEYEEIGSQSGFHSFTSLIDFYVNIMISHQIDKLDNFAGDHWLDSAVRIAQNAKFDQNSKGWYERGELIETLVSEDVELQRTLSWVYHVSLYFYEEVENKYEAWNAAALCVDILEELPDDESRERFFAFAYYKLGNILKEGKDPSFLERMLRMDDDDTHEEYYYRLIDDL
jgi:hypothetical protein